MTGVAQAWLVGVINPLGQGPSVLVPVLSDRPGGNTLFLQKLDRAGQVAGFQPFESDEVDRKLRNDDLSVLVGEDGLWGLEFPAGDRVVAPRADLAARLEGRRDEFQEQTLLYLSAARVLWEGEPVRRALRDAWLRLRDLNAGTAETWRRTVAVPALARTMIESELRGLGTPPTRRQLEGITFEDNGGFPLVLLPVDLFQPLHQAGLLDDLRRELAAVAEAVDLGAPVLEPFAPAEITAGPAHVTPARFPITVIGLGAGGAGLVEQLRGNGDETPEADAWLPLELRLRATVHPSVLPDTQLVSHPEAAALQKRIAAAQKPAASPGARARPNSIVVVVFGFGTADPAAARELAAHLTGAGVTVVGVLLQPAHFDTRNRNWLKSTDFERLQSAFSMFVVAPQLPRSATPSGRAGQHLTQLLLLLRIIAPLPMATDTLWIRRGHARIAVAELGDHEDGPMLFGRCMAELRSLDIELSSAEGLVAVLELPTPDDRDQQELSYLLESELARRADGARWTMFVTKGDGLRLTMAAVGLRIRDATPEVFETVCRRILEDLDCEVFPQPAGPVDFFATGPGVTMAIETKAKNVPLGSKDLAGLADWIRSTTDVSVLVLTNAQITKDASEAVRALPMQIVDYRDLDGIIKAFKAEYLTFFGKIEAADSKVRTDLLHKHLAAYVVRQMTQALTQAGRPAEPDSVRLATMGWTDLPSGGLAVEADVEFASPPSQPSAHPLQSRARLRFEVTADGVQPMGMTPLPEAS